MKIVKSKTKATLSYSAQDVTKFITLMPFQPMRGLIYQVQDSWAKILFDNSQQC